MSWVGSGPYSTRAPVIREPTARPLIGARPLTTPARPGDSGGSRSTSAAPIVVIAIPVATPWTTRAAISTPTSPATMKSTIATASRAIEAAISGRLPT